MSLDTQIAKLKLNLIVEAILNKKISHWALLAFVGIAFISTVLVLAIL
tara:strand:- start:136 stop:279 length:144 start_codon:yes stop_codon:yes gene_type:complete